MGAFELPDNPRQLALSFIKTPAKTNDLVEDCRRDNCHKSKLRLLQILSGNDEMIELVLNMVLNGKATNREKAMGRESSYFNEQGTKTFGKIPKYWTGEWCVRVSKKLTPDDIKSMDKVSPNAIRNLFFFFTALDPNTALPKKALEKTICDRVCTGRATEVGNRFVHWKSVALRADYTVDCGKGGAYSIDTKTPIATIKHVSGEEVDFPKALRPEHITMTEPHRDIRCQMEMQGVLAMRLRDLFKKDIGPNDKKILNPKKLYIEAHTNRIYDELMAVRAAAAQRNENDAMTEQLESDMKKNSNERRAAARPKDAPKWQRKSSLVIQLRQQ